MEDGRGRKRAVRRSFVTAKGNRAVQARSQLIAAVWLRVDPLLPFSLLLTWTLYFEQATNFRRSDARGHSA